VNFGHAGNGNIHVNLLVNPDNADEMKRAYECLDEVFSLVLSLQGTLSGEHGVGMAKRPFVPREIDETTINLMKSLKLTFDPNNVLNPGKLFPQVINYK
jgi:D-lactate dehydrogenase